jgi:hypothetical protein
MKLLSASVILFGSAMADKWAKLGDMWNGLSQSDKVNDDDRKIIELFTISSVANYGCWCRFNQYKPYKGTPQDTVDQACKQWWQNYDCLAVDYNTETPLFRCNMDHDYTDVIVSLADPFDPATDYEAACTAANTGDDCAIQSCHTDAVFIRHVFLFLADNTLNMTLSGWYGFDGSVCTGATSGGTTATPGMATTVPPQVMTTAPAETTLVPPVPGTLCCGAYPNRFPYKTQGGDRQCCVDTTYNVNVLTCCPPLFDSLAVIGTC